MHPVTPLGCITVNCGGGGITEREHQRREKRENLGALRMSLNLGHTGNGSRHP